MTRSNIREAIMIRSRHRPSSLVSPAALAGIAGLAVLGTATPLQAQEEGVRGDYVVVAIRRASDVAGGPDDPSLGGVAIGTTVSFGDTLTWLWGEECADWSVEGAPAAIVFQEAPLLSDAQIGPPIGDAVVPDNRRNEHMSILCEGTSVGAFLKVDRRVLVAPSPSGLSNVILERPLDSGQVSILQRALGALGHYGGAVTGALDAETRRGVALYAESQGAAYAFHGSALSANLLDGLGVPTAEAAALALLKTVYSGPVAAHFMGVEAPLPPRTYGVRELWFSFEGEDDRILFRPTGRLHFSDWYFDELYSPDGTYVILPQDRYGPYHVVRADRLADYLTGAGGPDRIVSQPADAAVRGVHSDVRWLSGTEVSYRVACCGDQEIIVENLAPLVMEGYEPKLSRDRVLDYRRLLDLESGAVGEIRLDDLPALADRLDHLIAAARARPGHWEDGNLALGADLREFVPSDEELLAADLGQRIAAFLESAEPDAVARIWATAGRDGYKAAFTTFDFRHVDVMGSGRFFYASLSEVVIIRLP
jgi:hypothetical protein